MILMTGTLKDKSEFFLETNPMINILGAKRKD
jgi:hypothetical protein